MNQFAADNWPLLAIAAVVALALLWWIFVSSRRIRVTIDRRDALDEDAAPTLRNQALIDAPPPLPPIVPEAVGGAGIAVAAAALGARLQGDDLTRIKGLGPRLAATLGELGVMQFADIAAWSEADIDRIDAQLGRFQGRIRRDDWVGQARLLETGDLAGFESRFGAQ